MHRAIYFIVFSLFVLKEHTRTEARRKNLLILILHYLTEEGYVDAANALEQEAKGGLRRFEVCDNVDLETILMEYESYYYVKFQKYPKITKKGQIIDFRGLIQDAIKGASSEISLHSFSCNPDPSDIYLHNPNIKWDDIIGLEAAKRLVKEAVVYPIRESATLMAYISPVATPTRSCLQAFFLLGRDFYSMGLQVLFELARYHAPSTIFLDELESVMSQRGTVPGGEHEGSRRMKTELLVQMDGLARSDDLVFVLAASNLPWELDYAMLRRLEKRILVDLPNPEARQAMIQHWLPPEMEGYSGSDVKLVCKEAAMRPVRKIFSALESHQPDSGNLPVIHLDTVTTEDFLDVISHTKPSAKNLSQRYVDWQREFESV
ncbi:hypothetical protein Chor_011774 [Crotalus horridus]